MRLVYPWASAGLYPGAEEIQSYYAESRNPKNATQRRLTMRPRVVRSHRSAL